MSQQGDEHKTIQNLLEDKIFETVNQDPVMREAARAAVRRTLGDADLADIRRLTTETIMRRGMMDFNKNQPKPTDLDAAREILLAQGWRVEPPIHDGGVNIAIVFEPVEGDLHDNTGEVCHGEHLSSVPFAQRHTIEDRRRILADRLEATAANIRKGEFDEILGDD